jgi:putative Flp pilus-assembly TadE/G-like protein
MPKLKVRFLGRRRDAGGVAVIVGILMATGVLLGTTALVVDVGQLYVEREQLQSAADAGAMAVALDCIHHRETDCDLLAEQTARDYANRNSGDGVSDVLEVCGQDPQHWLEACAGTEPSNLTKCIGGNPDNTRGWVRVRTATERPGAAGDSSRFILPSVFARTLAGGVKGTEVGACSRVAWGTPATAFAFTVCENIFNDFTNNGVDLAPAPPARPSFSDERVFSWSSFGRYRGRCDDGTNPLRTFDDGRWTVNADFGWMTGLSGGCTFPIADTGQLSRATPASPQTTSNSCYTTLRSARSNARPLTVAVLRQTGRTSYTVVGVAAFVVTGYRLDSGRRAASTITRRTCGTSVTVCVNGYFVGALIPNERLNPSTTSPYGTFGAAEDLGAAVVKTVG